MNPPFIPDRIFPVSQQLVLTALWLGVNLPALDAQTTGSTNVPPTKDIYELREIQASLAGNKPLPIKLETYLSHSRTVKGEPENPPKDEDIYWSASKGTPTFSPEKGGSVELDFGQPFVKEANPEARKVKVTASYSGSASVQPSSQSKDVERVYLDFWIAETEERNDDVIIVRAQDAQPTADEKKIIHWAKVVVKHSAPSALPLELISSGDDLLYFYGEEQDPNQRSEDPPLESTLKKELENGQWFWIGTDAKGTGQAKFKAKGDAGKGLKDAPEENTVNLLPVDIVPDYNRDGKIDSADRGKVTTEKPFRWWINDDNDLTSAERGEGNQDIPTQNTSDRDCNDLAVDGMKDLIDFFPLHLDLKSALAVLPESEFKYVLKHEDEALKFYEHPTCVVDGSEEGKEPNRHVKDVGTGRGLAAKALKLASSQGSELSANMLINLKEGRGVLVIEGAKKTTKPLILEILKKSDNSSIGKVDFPIRIADVEEMYRHVNMRDVTGGSGGHSTQTGEPSGYPDDLTNGKYVAFVHGYNVSVEYARGTQSNIFKRFHQLGSKARYIGVSWFGDPPNPGINLVLPPDYHQAVDNGLKAGIVAKVRLGFTQGSSLTVLAHSLGNSLAGSAIANHGLEVEQYYIINGAIPLQAYDSLQTSNSSGHPDMKRNMTEDDWKPFYDHGNGEQQRLFSSNWHELFAATPTDNRNKLTWKDIFAKPQLLNVAYNFYSPSDEVVENADETEEFGDWANLWDAGHGGRHAWVQQEIVKGGQHAVAASSFHDLNGGWRFNNNPTANTPLEAGYAKENLTGTGWRPYTVAEAAAEITDAELKLVPYHLPFLYHGLYDPAQGSSTAGVTTNRYKLLGSGIPATSYAIAANDLPKLNQVNGGEQRNFNMPQALRSSGGYSSWPEDENSKAPEDWMHSDFNDVALQFLHPMYQKMIDLAELDKN